MKSRLPLSSTYVAGPEALKVFNTLSFDSPDNQKKLDKLNQPRSFIIQNADGQKYRRNHEHLRPDSLGMTLMPTFSII